MRQIARCIPALSIDEIRKLQEDLLQTDARSLYKIDLYDEWENLKSEDEKFALTQLSYSAVKKMNTDYLLDAILDNPMLYTIEKRVNRTEGAQIFVNKLLAGKELIKRKDFKKTILNEYLDLDVPEKTLNDYSEISKCSDKELDDTIMRLLEDQEFSDNLDADMEIYHKLHFLEGIILSDYIYDSLSTYEKRKIYTKSLELNKEKQESEIFSYCSEDSFSKEIEGDKDIVQYARLMKSVQPSITTIYVYTPNGTKVEAKQYSDNHINSDACVAEWKKKEGKSIIRVIARGYSRSNCHAYAWAGNSSVWIRDANAYVSDGSYKEVQAGGKATALYQKVYAGNGGHSAIVFNLSGRQIVRAKMSGSPIYENYLDVEFQSGHKVYSLVC